MASPRLRPAWPLIRRRRAVRSSRPTVSVPTTAAADSLSRTENFEPFDLEAFWGRRLFEKLTTN